jgi:hypothetical protein
MLLSRPAYLAGWSEEQAGALQAMMYLHTSFDLAEGVSLDAYKSALREFTAVMKSGDLIVDTGPVLERCRHPVMDTDEERGHQYFFVMSFADRAQCDAAVRHIQSADPGGDPAHRALQKDIIRPIFSCWVDS